MNKQLKKMTRKVDDYRSECASLRAELRYQEGYIEYLEMKLQKVEQLLNEENGKTMKRYGLLTVFTESDEQIGRMELDPNFLFSKRLIEQYAYRKACMDRTRNSDGEWYHWDDRHEVLTYSARGSKSTVRIFIICLPGSIRDIADLPMIFSVNPEASDLNVKERALAFYSRILGDDR